VIEKQLDTILGQDVDAAPADAADPGVGRRAVPLDALDQMGLEILRCCSRRSALPTDAASIDRHIRFRVF
jgi:hypothetical protein